MSFKFPKAGRSYFDKIMFSGGAGSSDKFSMFDMYYFCLMIGFSMDNFDNEEGKLEIDEFTKSYPDQYRENSKDYITGLLISSEMKRTGTRYNDTSLQSLMLENIDIHSETNISSRGFERLNFYAVRGLEEIMAKQPFQPQSREEFLIFFYKLINAINEG